MYQTMLVIKGELTDLNEYVRIERGNKFAGAKVKREETNRIWAECIQQKIELQKKGCFIVFQWYSKDRRKDKDNVAFAKKFILDGLVLARIIKSDGWDFVSGFLDIFYIDEKDPRVEVYFGEEPNRIEIKRMYEIS